MRAFSVVRGLGILVIAVAVANPSPAEAVPWCRDFGFGNGGYAAGYSMAVARRWGWGYGGSLCRPPVACWRPCWNPCWRPGVGAWCGPGVSYGWPGVGWGWAGSTTFFGTQSVYLAAPIGGGAAFFSGGIVPFPVPYAVPYAVPYPVPAFAPWPWFGAVQSPVRGQAVAIARAAPAPAVRAGRVTAPQAIAAASPSVSPSVRLRAAHPASRRRAVDLVATGDRQLREAGGDAVRLKAAVETYRKAAAAAADDPDIHIRHAIALTAVGRHGDADLASRRAVALDGRLGHEAGEHQVGEPTPLAARGAAILREIAAADPDAAEPLAKIAVAWATRAAGPLARLAAVSGDR